MAFRHINELPLGDRIFRVELSSDDDTTVTLTLTGWRESLPNVQLASGTLTMPLTDVPTLRIALSRGLRALALAADVAEPVPDREALGALFSQPGAPWLPERRGS